MNRHAGISPKRARFWVKFDVRVTPSRTTIPALGTVLAYALPELAETTLDDPRGHQAGNEVRRGVGRDEPAADLQVDGRCGPRAELVERHPLAADLGLQHQPVAAVLEPVGLERGLLDAAGLDPDRRGWCLP